MARTVPDDHAETMRGIRTFAQVVQYLLDDQGWPNELLDHLVDDDLTEVTYDWDPDELGIPAEQLKDLKRLQQMRPLTVNQPWGVFFLEFGGPRLRYTPIRRLLRALVTKKRAAGAAGTRTWDLSDLLFIVITGTGDDVELHVLAFEGDDPQKAEFRSLAWRPAHAPTRHLQRLSEDLLPCLAWPGDENDVASWRKAWREAFKLPVGQAIRDSVRLVDRMAKTARDLCTQIREAVKNENGSGPFSKLMSDIRTQLVSDVNADSFADMCAQTLVYGMLSSRVTNPEDFGSSPIFSAVPVANPFLESLFEQVHDEAVSLGLPGSDLPQLVADLRATNVEAILDQIGSTAKGGDPVIHFYEEFLRKYDSQMRADAGAFYTPQPAVEFIVRVVDQVLRSRFGLRMGIADTASWQEVAEHNDCDVPEGVDPDKPFVSMIDPATGTGTFLVEWLRRAHKSFLEHGEAGEWPGYLRDRLLPSMHAFELMLAPYAIAHLKIALELHAVGAGDGAMQILLTDTLEHAARQGQLATMTDPVAQEGEKAAKLKESERFTIVIGNPPYDRDTGAAADGERRKGGVVRHGAPGTTPLFSDVVSPMSDAGLGGEGLNSIYDSYLYFWRWSVWQALELPRGPGIVALITSATYLDGFASGGMRHLLRNAFDEIWIVDLGGDSRGACKEENIFDIQTPVAIAIGISRRNEWTGECKVRYLRIWGTRSEKLSCLQQLSLDDVSESAGGEGLDPMTPRSASIYYDWPTLHDLFPWHRTGPMLGRTWPVGPETGLLTRRWRKLLSVVPRNRSELFADSRSGKSIAIKAKSLQTPGKSLTVIARLDRDDQPEDVKRYAFRTFDRQHIIADARLMDRDASVFWRAQSYRQIWLTTNIRTKLGAGPALTATPYVPDLHHYNGRGDKGKVALFRDAACTSPNVTDSLLPVLSEKIGIDVTVEELLAYVYALGGTGAFSDRFSDELEETAGPIHLPITADRNLFRQAVVLGRYLLWWHTWGERSLPKASPVCPRAKPRRSAKWKVCPTTSTTTPSPRP